MSKKAFEDLTSSSIYVASPMQLCIIGGLSLPEDQRGPLDTEADESALNDPRLALEIKPEHVRNVDAFGVSEPIIITKRNGKPTVVNGRQRVRWARLANIARRARGEPEITLQCRSVNADDDRLFGMMIALNEVRTDDSISAKIEKLNRLMNRGVSVEDAATVFGISVAYVKQLLTYNDEATPEVRAAVSSGSLSSTAAIHLVRNAKNDDAQRKAIEKLAGEKKPSTRKAIEAAKDSVPKLPSKKEIKDRLRSILLNEARTDYDEAFADALRWVLGKEEKDESTLDQG